MKDKNAAVVRTNRAGALCSEFEAFLYKHGAEIYQDSAAQHDLLMGVSQKLPTAISIAMALPTIPAPNTITLLIMENLKCIQF